MKADIKIAVTSDGIKYTATNTVVTKNLVIDRGKWPWSNPVVREIKQENVTHFCKFTFHTGFIINHNVGKAEKPKKIYRFTEKKYDPYVSYSNAYFSTLAEIKKELTKAYGLQLDINEPKPVILGEVA